jgi:hypothetical protein
MKNIRSYPSGADFAFKILDDTDDTTVTNGRPVYDLLKELGLRTTKTVWAFDTDIDNRGPYFAGETLSSPEYLKWVHELANDNFEIAFHNATMGTAVRADTIKALDIIKTEFGQPVRLHCNHGQNLENLHWGVDRYSSYIIKKTQNLLTRFQSYPVFEGNKPDSPYYWSDIADKQIDYMRAFAFRQLNCANIAPGRPYINPTKQKYTQFFNTADASDIQAYNQLVNRTSIDKLREQRGWTIISTHLGKGFYQGGQLDAEFKKNMEYLASLPGWFVPASQLLDFLKKESGEAEISAIDRFRLESSHLTDRIINRLFNTSDY